MKVQFLRDTSQAIIPAPIYEGNTLVIYRDGYKLPIIPNAQFIEFEKYKSSYINYHPDFIVMIGTNRIFIPSIRCELVFEYLQTMTSQIEKISIDTSPFIGEPWRLWYHYSLAYGTWLDYNYSYIVETDWQHWFYRDSEKSVISSESIKGNLLGTYSDLELLNTTYKIYEPDKMILQYYNEIKEIAFEKYSTPKQLIQFMLKQINTHLNIDFGFDTYLKNKEILLPDLPIVNFLIEENNRRMNIYNTALNYETKDI